ncbi:hypothetical protein COOONC_04882 [Cooperia oncophora]
MAATLDTQLTHHLLSTTGVKIGGGELMMYVSRMLRTATFQRRTQRYSEMVYSTYSMSADSKKKTSEWNEDKKRDPTTLALSVRSQPLKEISRAEKMILDEKVQNTVNFSNTFDIAMDKMEKRLLSAIANMTKKQDQSQAEAMSHSKRRRGSEDVQVEAPAKYRYSPTGSKATSGLYGVSDDSLQTNRGVPCSETAAEKAMSEAKKNQNVPQRTKVGVPPQSKTAAISTLYMTTSSEVLLQSKGRRIEESTTWMPQPHNLECALQDKD